MSNDNEREVYEFNADKLTEDSKKEFESLKYRALEIRGNFIKSLQEVVGLLVQHKEHADSEEWARYVSGVDQAISNYEAGVEILVDESKRFILKHRDHWQKVED